MRRSERLHLLTAELRAAGSRPVPAGWLAARLGVSRRTVARDVAGLRRAGVPVVTAAGRGYVLGGTARELALATGHPAGRRLRAALPAAPPAAPPAAVSWPGGVAWSDEAAWSDARGTGPGAEPAAEGAAEPGAGSDSGPVAEGAAEPGAGSDSGPVAEGAAEPGATGRVLLFRRRDERRRDAVLTVLESAVASGEVVAFRYVDREGEWSVREVEPAGLVRGVDGWYLVGWCRLRGAGRAFLLDRVSAAWPTGERAAPHPIRGVVPDVPAGCAAGGRDG